MVSCNDSRSTSTRHLEQQPKKDKITISNNPSTTRDKESVDIPYSPSALVKEYYDQNNEQFFDANEDGITDRQTPTFIGDEKKQESRQQLSIKPLLAEKKDDTDKINVTGAEFKIRKDLD